MSRSIFILTVVRGGPGLFSNSLSHAGDQEYFLIDCRTRVSRSIFKLTVARGQGWAPRPAGNPPRGEGGVPRPAPRCGEGGVPRPAPPRKNDQNRGEVAGQNKYPNLNFLQKRKEVMEQYYNTEQCPIQPVNRICKRK